VRLSVQDEGEEEAYRYKWIESEKAGRDLGEWAILCWVKKHWNGFLRERWLEHLHGRTYWIELDCNDFGLLNRRFCGSVLFEKILAKLKAGQENLHIVNWAIDCHQPMTRFTRSSWRWTSTAAGSSSSLPGDSPALTDDCSASDSLRHGPP